MKAVPISYEVGIFFRVLDFFAIIDHKNPVAAGDQHH